MKKRIDKPVKSQTAITFISGSAGELDWALPILDFLLNKGFNVKIIFLTRQARKNVEENRLLNDFIYQENSKVEVIICGGYLFEKIIRLGYLSYRIFRKLKLGKNPIINKIYSLYDKVFENLFMRRLPSDILHFKNEKYLFISEFPSLRRPRDIWLRQNFIRSTFFYCPHSPHIYAEELDRKYPEPDFIDVNKKFFLLLGHPGDYFIVNDGRELAAPDLEKVFIGHPKYSNSWLHNHQEKAKKFRLAAPTRETTNILVISRGVGSYTDKQYQRNLVESTIKVIHSRFPNYNLLVKKHPREQNSHWDNILDDYSSIKIVNDHILQIASRVDFVISFWSSGAMDCFSLGVPTIEYFDPNKHPKQQVPEGDAYTTIYRKLGIVLPANNEEELRGAVSSLVSENYKMPSDRPHSFYSELITRSNQWDNAIEKILVSHNIIN
jgi:hypothetical protein